VTRTVPKAEIHCHIEGAASPELVRAQAKKYGVDVASFLDARGYVWSDFTTFLIAYDAAAALFRTAEDYAALAETYLTDIAAEGAIYAEIFVSPDHAERSGIGSGGYLAGLAEGIGRARATTGIECRMIVVGIRHFGADAVEAAARFAAGRPHALITGFGMAGEERFGRVADYARAFDIARDAGLGITIHAGELAGPDSVRDALDIVRPGRIGHGARAIEDAALVDRIAREGVVLELCPGSNVALGVFADWSAHPFEAMREAGVRVTLNSDDPPHFHSSIGHEYEMAARTWGYDPSQLRAFTRTALEAAFVDAPTREKLLGQLG
jgi:adenosine deaminase